MLTLNRIRAILRDGDDHEVRDLANQIMLESEQPPTRVLRFMEKMVPDVSLFVCAFDGRTVDLVDESYSWGDEMICERSRQRHFSICEHCDELHQNSSMHAYRRNGLCCVACAESDLSYSEETDSYWPPSENPDNDVDDDDDDDTIIAPRRSGIFSRNLVLSYSTNVLDVLRGQGFRFEPDERLPLAPLWMGVELEVEPREFMTRDYIAITQETIADFAILKSDSSLGDGGMEIVTVPQTLEAHRRAWQPFFETAAPLLQSWKTNGRCGMHVHISRAALSDLQLGRMLEFVNSRNNVEFITAVAGRGHTHYSRLDSNKKIADVKRAHSIHGEALAFTERNNGKTVELRIFRGNVSKDGFFKNLDFTAALCGFCKHAGSRQLTAAHFLLWLSQAGNLRAYPYLASWATKKGLIQSNRVVPEKYAAKVKIYAFEEA